MIRSARNIFLIVILLTAALVIIYLNSSRPKHSAPQIDKEPASISQQDDFPKIVSTKPDPLEDAVISATETVEITFNRPLENVGEFKIRIEPKIDIKAQLSSDRKTARIIPAQPFELGTTYTLFIGTETKFDGVGRWGEEKIFHFKTIQYRGV